MSCISSTVKLHASSASAMAAAQAKLSASAAGAHTSVSVRQQQAAVLRVSAAPGASLSAQTKHAAMELSQICPIHYGMNVLADDGVSMLAWDDGTLLKW